VLENLQRYTNRILAYPQLVREMAFADTVPGAEFSAEDFLFDQAADLIAEAHPVQLQGFHGALFLLTIQGHRSSGITGPRLNRFLGAHLARHEREQLLEAGFFGLDLTAIAGFRTNFREQ